MLLGNAGQSILEDSRSQIKTSALVVLGAQDGISQSKRGPGH